MKEMTLRERLATMTWEEILESAVAAAWGDRTHAAEHIAQFGDSAEDLVVFLGDQDPKDCDQEELLARHSELRKEKE